MISKLYYRSLVALLTIFAFCASTETAWGATRNLVWDFSLFDGTEDPFLDDTSETDRYMRYQQGVGDVINTDNGANGAYLHMAGASVREGDVYTSRYFAFKPFARHGNLCFTLATSYSSSWEDRLVAKIVDSLDSDTKHGAGNTQIESNNTSSIDFYVADLVPSQIYYVVFNKPVNISKVRADWADAAAFIKNLEDLYPTATEGQPVTLVAEVNTKKENMSPTPYRWFVNSERTIEGAQEIPSSQVHVENFNGDQCSRSSITVQSSAEPKYYFCEMYDTWGSMHRTNIASVYVDNGSFIPVKAPEPMIYYRYTSAGTEAVVFNNGKSFPVCWSKDNWVNSTTVKPEGYYSVATVEYAKKEIGGSDERTNHPSDELLYAKNLAAGKYNAPSNVVEYMVPMLCSQDLYLSWISKNNPKNQTNANGLSLSSDIDNGTFNGNYINEFVNKSLALAKIATQIGDPNGHCSFTITNNTGSTFEATECFFRITRVENNGSNRLSYQINGGAAVNILDEVDMSNVGWSEVSVDLPAIPNGASLTFQLNFGMTIGLTDFTVRNGGKRKATLSIKPSSLDIMLNNTAEFNFSTNSDGVVSAASSDPAMVSVVSCAAGRIVVRGNRTGSTTITVKVPETSNYRATTKKVHVTVNKELSVLDMTDYPTDTLVFAGFSAEQLDAAAQYWIAYLGSSRKYKDEEVRDYINPYTEATASSTHHYDFVQIGSGSGSIMFKEKGAMGVTIYAECQGNVTFQLSDGVNSKIVSTESSDGSEMIPFNFDDPFGAEGEGRTLTLTVTSGSAWVYGMMLSKKMTPDMNKFTVESSVVELYVDPEGGHQPHTWLPAKDVDFHCENEGATVTWDVEKKYVMKEDNGTIVALAPGHTYVYFTQRYAVGSVYRSVTLSRPVTVIRNHTNAIANELKTWVLSKVDYNTAIGELDGLYWDAAEQAAYTPHGAGRTSVVGLNMNNDMEVTMELPVGHTGGILTATLGSRSNTDPAVVLVNDAPGMKSDWYADADNGFTDQSEFTTPMSWRIEPGVEDITLKKLAGSNGMLTSLTWMPVPTSVQQVEFTLPYGSSNSHEGCSCGFSVQNIGSSSLSLKEYGFAFKGDGSSHKLTFFSPEILSAGDIDVEILLESNADVWARYELSCDGSTVNSAEGWSANAQKYRIPFKIVPDGRYELSLNNFYAVINIRGSIPVEVADRDKTVTKSGLQAGHLSTICYPFDINVEDEEGATFMSIAYGDNPSNKYSYNGQDLPTRLVFDTVTHLRAGYPYFVLPKEGTDHVDLVYENLKSPSITPHRENGLYGAYDNFTLGEHAWESYKYFGINSTKNTISHMGKTSYAQVGRAYIVLSEVPTKEEYEAAHASAPRRRLAVGQSGLEWIEPEETSIEEVTTVVQEIGSNRIDLLGRQVSGSTKGIVVSNGKLILVK